MRIDGRQRRTFSATEAEAKRSLRQLLKSVDDGRPVADGNLLLSSLLDQWEAKVLPNKNIKGSTMGRHKWALNILRADLGSTKVRTLSPERLEKALTDRARAGYPRSSLTKLRGTLSQVLKWGVRRGLVARNVASVVELPTEARAPKEGRSMLLGQAREFIAAAVNSRLEAIRLAMIYLGLRPGEAAGLSWPDIDFDRKTIHIWRAISRGEHGAIILSEPKTAQSVRSPDVVLDAFRGHRIEQKRHQLEVGEISSNPEALVFTSPTGHPIDPMVCRKDFKKLVGSIGLDDWTPNELRHSAASLMSDVGMPHRAGC